MDVDMPSPNPGRRRGSFDDLGDFNPYMLHWRLHAILNMTTTTATTQRLSVLADYEVHHSGSDLSLIHI